MTRTIRIVMVDDHALLRETLRDRLASEPDIDVVGTAQSADEAVPMALELQPDVLLMDIDMPGLSCFDAARTIKDGSPDTSVIFLSAFFHDRYIESALQSQATGYVTKDEHPDVVVKAVRAAAAQVAYFSPKVSARIVVDTTGVRLGDAPVSRASRLTARELEVLRYLARGLPKKEIAVTMNVSVKTVSRHTENIMEKLDIHDRVELARFAIREGLAEA
ncbi:MAG: response regulator transcription factor [Planctomycetes bacterium]|nr:response regulator transcription factor [Planctomycetota bacterium]